MSSEKAALNAEPKKFYFLNKRSPKEGDGGDNNNDNVTVKDKDKGLELVDRIYNNQKTAVIGSTSKSNVDSNSWSEGPIGTWVKGIFGRRSDHNYQLMSERKPLPRKVPIKVEPKVFFANERTFLAWLHMSITLASISVAIVAFAEDSELSQIYGILLLPVAIAFCCYSLWMYIKRANMIRRKDPGPYEDKFGPIALAALLGLSITINFIVKLYDMTYEHQPQQPPSMKPTHISSSVPTTH
jgi:uncharacterized membrane protein YidH (DUF202 family)